MTLVPITKFNPNHAPAGDEHGGEFTSGDFLAGKPIDTSIAGATKAMRLNEVATRLLAHELLGISTPADATAARIKTLFIGDEQLTDADIQRVQNRLDKIRETFKEQLHYSDEDLRESLRTGLKADGSQFWYQSSEVIHNMLGADTAMFNNFLAVSSVNADVSGNTTFALSLYAQWIEAGRMVPPGGFKGVLGDVADNAARAVRGEALEGLKIQNFARALSGDASAMTVDRWMYRAIGFGDTVSGNDTQYRVAAEIGRYHALRAGMTNAEWQAAVWRGAVERYDYSSARQEAIAAKRTYDSFASVLQRRLQAGELIPKTSVATQKLLRGERKKILDELMRRGYAVVNKDATLHELLTTLGGLAYLEHPDALDWLVAMHGLVGDIANEELFVESAANGLALALLFTEPVKKEFVLPNWDATHPQHPDFDASKHPRQPAGIDDHGGEFVVAGSLIAPRLGREQDITAADVHDMLMHSRGSDGMVTARELPVPKNVLAGEPGWILPDGTVVHYPGSRQEHGWALRRGTGSWVPTKVGMWSDDQLMVMATQAGAIRYRTQGRSNLFLSLDGEWNATKAQRAVLDNWMGRAGAKNLIAEIGVGRPARESYHVSDKERPDQFGTIYVPDVSKWTSRQALDALEDARRAKKYRVLKFNQNHAPAGTPIGGQFTSGDAVFASPNEHDALPEGETLDFEKRRLATAQAMMARKLGLQTTDYDGTGGWADGSEPTRVIDFAKGSDPDDIRLFAAMSGELANQKAVINWHADANGPDNMMTLTVPGDPATVRATLLHMGVEYHTLIPRGSGTEVRVLAQADQNQLGTMSKVLDVGRHYGQKVHYARGHGEFIGSWDSRDAGHQAYRSIIDDAVRAGKIDGTDRGWWRRLDMAWQRGRATVGKFNPNHEPAGSPAGGQFASGLGLPADVTYDPNTNLSLAAMAAGKGNWKSVLQSSEHSWSGDTHTLRYEPRDAQPGYVKGVDGHKQDVLYDPTVAIVGHDDVMDRPEITLRPEFAGMTEIPAKPEAGTVFRGMSADEYRQAVAQGYIESDSSFNFENQQGTTLFSVSPRQASSYASGFAPWHMQPTGTHPGYVVQVREPGTRVPEAEGGDDERAYRGRVPTSDILAVYEAKPWLLRNGDARIVPTMGYGGTKYTHESGSGSAPGSYVLWRKVLRKFNPNHAPAGDEHGGEFTSGSAAVADYLAAVDDDPAWDPAMNDYNEVAHDDESSGDHDDAANALLHAEAQRPISHATAQHLADQALAMNLDDVFPGQYDRWQKYFGSNPNDHDIAGLREEVANYLETDAGARGRLFYQARQLYVTDSHWINQQGTVHLRETHPSAIPGKMEQGRGARNVLQYLIDSPAYTTMHNMVLYRGVHGYHAVGDLKDLNVGDSFTGPGFVSTSSDKRITGMFGQFSRIDIRVPKGTQALMIPGREQEYLLPIGTTFTIREKINDKFAGAKWTMVVDAHPPARISRIFRKFNPNHAPPGDEHGGEFTFADAQLMEVPAVRKPRRAASKRFASKSDAEEWYAQHLSANLTWEGAEFGSLAENKTLQAAYEIGNELEKLRLEGFELPSVINIGYPDADRDTLAGMEISPFKGAPRMLLNTHQWPGIAKFNATQKALYDKGIDVRGNVASSMHDVLVHELGHYAHFKNRIGNVPRMKAYNLNEWDEPTLADTAFMIHMPEYARSISRYAAYSPAEFVAEAYNHQYKGGVLTPEQARAYKLLRGPTLPSKRGTH